MMKNKKRYAKISGVALLLAFLLVCLVACKDSGGDTTGGDIDNPATDGDADTALTDGDDDPDTETEAEAEAADTEPEQEEDTFDGNCPEDLVPVGDGCEALRLPDIAAEWTQIKPGAPTICGRGGEYSYWVRGGTVNKLLVSFAGGGACWNVNTCMKKGAIPSFFIDELDETQDPDGWDGIFDFENPDNPFKDWYIVHVSYCSGDLHWGDAETTYASEDESESVTVTHRGFINTGAALGWIAEHFNSPEQLVITGASAGAYGSMFYAPILMRQFPFADALYFGDSCIGLIDEDFLSRYVQLWGAPATFPDFLPGFSDLDWDARSMIGYSVASANRFATNRFAVYTSANDFTQEFYFTTMGHGYGEWNLSMEATIAAISDQTANFSSFVDGGSHHTAIYADLFYTAEEGGTSLREWLANLIDGQPVSDVHCQNCEE